ncbi:MAG: hypothetical protein R8G66_02880 [Cytophagales bacterium]|nr:hypothetical protein [Cytophagales bacterium]
MSNTLYYGEIVARIAGRLYSLNHANDNEIPSSKDMSMEDMICDVSADAGRVFDSLEELSGEHFIDWRNALEYYSDALLSFILDGRMPTMADMISMAAKAMDISRAERVAKAKSVL